MAPVLYESPWVLVVNKPAGLSVEKGKYPSVEAWAEPYVAGQPGKNFVGIVHRLDRPVSGALVLAKRKQALKMLNAQFRERRVEKVYWALTPVLAPSPAGPVLLRHWHRKNAAARRAELFDEPVAGAAEVQLRYRLRQATAAGSLLEIELLTGKYHQIRAQLAAAGFPILGDARYGSRQAYLPEAIALHARRLAFIDPQTETPVEVVAPPPDNAFWRALAGGSLY